MVNINGRYGLMLILLKQKSFIIFFNWLMNLANGNIPLIVLGFETIKEHVYPPGIPQVKITYNLKNLRLFIPGVRWSIIQENLEEVQAENSSQHSANSQHHHLPNL
jgi:hypothetical protein